MTDLEIFHSAPENATPDELAAYLDDACGDDTALRGRVEALFAAEELERSHDFLECGAVIETADAETAETADSSPTIGPNGEVSPTPRKKAHALVAAQTEKADDRIGPYTLIEPLGTGGFGTVWKAEQSIPLKRTVALKVIKAGMDTSEVLSRFEAERQALARMDHAHIAKVLDAGATENGRPYFVMELVDGMPITNYCDERGLGTRARLELFREVCAAVNHAHQKGMIHRDLKPSNVMVAEVDGKPVVKVIDFGIAKATEGKLTEESIVTLQEQLIGTPAYMSPEQAGLDGQDIDTRSDIYSLGVLLYELLSGKPPFDPKTLLSAGYDEMRRIIREEEPMRPSLKVTGLTEKEETITLTKTHGSEPEKLGRQLRGDLDWIVMKAIEKDRGRRYETASAFAMDLERFLADEPVLAVAPSAAYKFKKFARRNRAAFSVAAAMVALLLGGIAAASWQAVRATEAREEAEAVSAFLVDMFGKAQPGEEKGGREVLVADILDDAVAQLEADEAIPPTRRAKLQASLGQTYFALGLYPQAIELQEEVRDYRVAFFGPEHPDTWRAMHNLAGSYRYAGRLDEALKLREEMLALSRKVNGPAHSTTLWAIADLTTSYGDAGRHDEALKMSEEVLDLSRRANGTEHPNTFGAMTNLAVSYREAGRLEDAIQLQEQSLAIKRRVLPESHPYLLNALRHMALLYERTGRKNEALEMQEEVLALYRKVSGSEHPDTLWAIQELALFYSDTGRRDEALKLREEVLALCRKVLGAEHPDTLKAMQNLALSYSDTGRRDEALEMEEEVLALRRKVLGAEHPDTLKAMQNLAISYSYTGRRDEALEMEEEVLALRRKVLGAEHPDTLSAMTNLANSYSHADRLEEALKMREEVLELRRKVSGPEHPDTLRVMIQLTFSYHDAGRRDEALKLREEVLALSRKVLGAEHPDTITAMIQLAFSYHDADRLEKAIELSEELLPLSRKVLGDEHPGTLKAMHNLAFSYRDADRLEKAIELSEELLPLSRKVKGDEHLDTLGAMTLLAVSYRDADRLEKAIELSEELLALRRKLLGEEHLDTLGVMAMLARSYRDAGRLEEGLKLFEELLALRRKVLGDEHPDTLSVMNKLAGSYHDAGRRDEALKLREEVLALSRKVLGAEDPETIGAMTMLAISYQYTGRRDEALKMREEVLPLYRKVNGPKHPDTLGAMTNLAGSYANANRLPEAIKLQEEALALKRQFLPLNHPFFAAALGNLAGFYEKAGRKNEALELRGELRELSVEVSIKKFGPEDRKSLEAQRNLITTLYAAGQDGEARAQLEEMLATCQSVRDRLDPMKSETPEYREDADRLSDLIYQLNLVAAVQVWLGKAEDHAALSDRVLELAAGVKHWAFPQRAVTLVCLGHHPDQAVRERVVETIAAKESTGWNGFTLGLARMRAGDLAGAKRILASLEEESNDELRRRSAIRRVSVLWRLGRTGEARKLLEKLEAELSLDPDPEDPRDLIAGGVVGHKFVLRPGLREARELLAITPEMAAATTAESPQDVEAWHRLAVIHLEAGDAEAAAEAIREALSHDAGNTALWALLPNVMENRALDLGESEGTEQEHVALQEAAALVRLINQVRSGWPVRVGGADGANEEAPDADWDKARIGSALATVRDWTGSEAWKNREEEWRFALAVTTGDPDTAIDPAGWKLRALAQLWLGRASESVAALNQVIEETDLIAAGIDSAHADFVLGGIVALREEVNRLTSAQRHADAVNLGQQTLAVSRRFPGSEHPGTLRVMQALAIPLGKEKRWEEAVAVTRAIREQIAEWELPQQFPVLEALRDLARDLAWHGKEPGKAEARELREAYLRAIEAVKGPDDVQTGYACLGVADSRAADGKRDEALELRLRALEIGQQHQHDNLIFYTKNRLAGMYFQMKRYDEALKLREETLPLARKFRGPEDHMTVGILNGLAHAYEKAGNLEKAIERAEEFLALRVKLNGEDDPKTREAKGYLLHLRESAEQAKQPGDEAATKP